jgi:hypothetical protein
MENGISGMRQHLIDASARPHIPAVRKALSTEMLKTIYGNIANRYDFQHAPPADPHQHTGHQGQGGGPAIGHEGGNVWLLLFCPTGTSDRRAMSSGDHPPVSESGLLLRIALNFSARRERLFAVRKPRPITNDLLFLLAERAGFEPAWGGKAPNRFRVGAGMATSVPLLEGAIG